MAQCVFQRYEKKYLLDENAYEMLRKDLEGYMIEDGYGWQLFSGNQEEVQGACE